ncbi:MAG: hypothetical protein ACRYG8_17870, partial [Janthinobacterium lividum]
MIHRNSLVRVVAAISAPWHTPKPPPLLAVSRLDFAAPPELRLFSGNQLRDLAPSSTTPWSPLSLLPTLEAPVAWEVDPAAKPRRTLFDAPRPDFLVAHGATSLRALLSPEEREGEWICTLRVAR